LIEALINKIIKLSKWGRNNDLKGEIFFDNMFVIFHCIMNCLSDYAREEDEDGVTLIYLRLKSLIFGLKKIMHYDEMSSIIKNYKEVLEQAAENPSDNKEKEPKKDPQETELIYEIKLSILHLITSLLEEGKAWKIVSDLS
jgi:hypothetical protein